MRFVKIDSDGFFVSDAPFARAENSSTVPHTATDGTKPDGMYKAQYVGGSWVDTAAPTATETLQAKREAAVLTRREFFLAIDAAGMYDAVMAMRNDPLTPRATVIELDTATEFKRMWPTLIAAAEQLQVTDAQLDAVFGIV